MCKTHHLAYTCGCFATVLYEQCLDDTCNKIPRIKTHFIDRPYKTCNTVHNARKIYVNFSEELATLEKWPVAQGNQSSSQGPQPVSRRITFEPTTSEQTIPRRGSLGPASARAPEGFRLSEFFLDWEEWDPAERRARESGFVAVEEPRFSRFATYRDSLFLEIPQEPVEGTAEDVANDQEFTEYAIRQIEAERQRQRDDQNPGGKNGGRLIGSVRHPDTTGFGHGDPRYPRLVDLPVFPPTTFSQVFDRDEWLRASQKYAAEDDAKRRRRKQSATSEDKAWKTAQKKSLWKRALTRFGLAKKAEEESKPKNPPKKLQKRRPSAPKPSRNGRYQRMDEDIELRPRSQTVTDHPATSRPKRNEEYPRGHPGGVSQHPQIRPQPRGQHPDTGRQVYKAPSQTPQMQAQSQLRLQGNERYQTEPSQNRGQGQLLTRGYQQYPGQSQYQPLPQSSQRYQQPSQRQGQVQPRPSQGHYQQQQTSQSQEQPQRQPSQRLHQQWYSEESDQHTRREVYEANLRQEQSLAGENASLGPRGPRPRELTEEEKKAYLKEASPWR